MAVDYNDDNIDNQVNGVQDNDSELEDEVMSDSESDEDFNTLYSCNICKSSDMEIGEFLIHSKNHTKEERQRALEKLVDCKVAEEVAIKNAAAAFGFQVQTSLESSVTLYLCTVCGQGNLLLKNLQEHTTIHPESTDSHFCNLCQKQFNDNSRLAAHLEIHLDNNDLFCQYCNRRFRIIEDLEMHESTHYQAEFVCVECRKHFRIKEYILIHLKEFHSTGTTCHICDKKFQTDYLIDSHFMIHAAINVVKRILKYFACEFCTKKYDSKISLQRHILFLHNDRIPFICEHCGFTAYHEESLNEHFVTDHSKGDIAMCYKCGLLFDEKSDLDAHMKEHVEDKSYTCKFCAATFKNPQNLKYHLTSHGDLDDMDFRLNSDNRIKLKNEEFKQDSEKDLLFYCKHCGETFDIKETYTLHLKYHLTTIFCDLCKKTFENDVLLNVHLNKVHTSKFCKPDLRNGVFPFKCNTCNASFRLEFELEDHNKIHNVVFYQCHLCFQEFIIDEELQEHMRIHNEDNDYQSEIIRQ